MKWAVLASGQSLTDSDVALVHQARLDGVLDGVAAISNVGLDKAPWADCLVSHDSAWWNAHPAAFDFAGEKICSNSTVRGGIHHLVDNVHGCNSGLLAMDYISRKKNASQIILLGFDMHGTHYFGPHVGVRLRNTTDARFQAHIEQFNRWKGCGIVNCTPGSALKKYAMQSLEETLLALRKEKGYI